MNKLLVIGLTIILSFNTFASSEKTDLPILHESISKLNSLTQIFEDDVKPVFQKFINDPNRILNRDEARLIRDFWTQFIDYRIVLNTLYSTHSESHSSEAILIKYTANLQLQKSAVFLSHGLWNNKVARKILDETNIKQVPRGSFVSMENSLFKQFNHGLNESEFPSFFPSYPLEIDRLLASENKFYTNDEIIIQIENLNSEAEKTLLAYENFLTLRSNIREVKYRFFIYEFKNIFFSLVKKIGSWLGATKVHNRDADHYNGQTYINDEMAHKMEAKVVPGDIMISKTEWFLSNIFLPGFWPHSYIYIGELPKFKLYFNDITVNQYFSNLCEKRSLNCYDLLSYLSVSPETQKAMKNYLTKDKYGNSMTVMEATRVGTHFSSYRNSFLNDYLAALRPRQTKLEKALAIVSLFEMDKKPYDYDFDIQTDDRLFCSETVVKAYLPSREVSGVNFHYDLENEKYLTTILGRMSLPVINIVHKFYDESVLGLRTPEMDFIAFLEGNPRTKTSTFQGVDKFLKTRDYSKWSFLRDN